MQQLPEIKFKSWMGKGELAKFARAMHAYWGHVQQALLLPLQKHDPLTAPIGIVDLLAWERGIERLSKEPEATFRARVNFAYRFARSGGETYGFKDILACIGIDFAVIHERVPNVDFDVIAIEMGAGDVSNNAELIAEIIRKYGRTCRRYRVSVTFPATQPIKHGQFSHAFTLYSAKK